MKRGDGLATLGLALAIALLASSAAVAQTGPGFVTYKVEVSTPSWQTSAVVNESVTSSSQAGLSDVVLQLISTQQNLTYSRLVNSSLSLFPFLSALASQSLTYSNATGTGLNLNFSASGTDSVSFQGSQYTLTVYSFAASGTYGNRSLSVNGTLETFPSSLVYSASVGNGTASARAVLQATNLQLSQSTSSGSTAAYVGAGVGAGGVALVAGFLVRRRDKKAAKEAQKPLHWVD